MSKSYFPKKCPVLGINYKVTFKPIDKDDPHYMGRFHHDKNMIYINPEQKIEERWRTLFHELGHAVMYRNGVRFSGQVPGPLEEIIVETMSSMIFECMNAWYPKFWEFEDE